MESIFIHEDIVENDLTYWEFINNSDIASDDDNCSIDTFSLDSLPSCHSSLSSSPTTTTITTSTTTTTTTNYNNNQTPLQDLTHHDDHDLDLGGGYVEEQVKYDVGFPYVEEQVKYDVGFPYVEEQVKYDVGFPYVEEQVKYDVGFPYVEEQVKYDVGFPHFYHHHGVVVDEGEEEGEDEDEDDELDDELVPWHLSGKLGRNRMRKLGKRASSKITSAKRNPYRYVKPGCVHGKHGMGLKGNY